METRGNDCSVLACIAGALPPEERAAHFSLIGKLFGDLVQERRELSDGYAYRFSAEVLEPIARFLANERKCCPFLTFELMVTAHSGPVWLSLTGPEGTWAVLDAELGAHGNLPA